jgi:putative transposase
LRPYAEYLQGAYKASERRACGVLNLQRSSHRYESVADEQAALSMRIRDLAAARVSYGYRRIHVLLQREGWRGNRKRVYRLYQQEGLFMRPKPPRRRVACHERIAWPRATSSHRGWSMDFMSDELVGGQRIRLLTIVDDFTRESPAIAVESRLPAHRVVEVLDRLAQRHRFPKTIRVDNGPEFTSKDLDQWVYLRGVQLDFSRPGKPTDNAFIEALGARARQECMNESWFLSLEDAQEKVAAWRWHYTTERPHGAVGNLPPQAFARAAGRTVG